MGAEEPRTEGERERIWEYYLHEHSQFNARLNFFLIAEAMLVVAAAQVLSSGETKPILGLGTSVTGMGLTIVWAYVNRRQTELMEFRRVRAKAALPEFAEGDRTRPRTRIHSTGLLAYGVPAMVLVVWLFVVPVALADLA